MHANAFTREYKRHAVVCLAAVLKTFTSLDVYDDVFTALQELLVEKVEEKGKEKEKDDEDAKARPLLLLTRAAAFEALGHSFAAV